MQSQSVVASRPFHTIFHTDEKRLSAVSKVLAAVVVCISIFKSENDLKMSFYYSQTPRARSHEVNNTIFHLNSFSLVVFRHFLYFKLDFAAYHFHLMEMCVYIASLKLIWSIRFVYRFTLPILIQCMCGKYGACGVWCTTYDLLWTSIQIKPQIDWI